MDVSTSGILFASAITVVVAVLGYALSRRRKESADTRTLQVSIAQELHIPPSLHPVIDPDICIGSLSCLKGCPEGDILGIVGGKAALIVGSNCIGHGRCALECPVDAIKLVFGTSERGIDLPEIDEFFESSRPGVHIVGELGGMGLIRNAMTQGQQVADRLRNTLPSGKGKGVDVAIVGAGPAGIATALACRQYGISFEILEQETLGGTVAQYPRQKVVMVDPVEIPFHGKLRKQRISKEELLSTFQHALSKAEIRVRENTKVLGIDGTDGAFGIRTSQGPIAARKVVLATGRRGSPRKLGVPGESLPKVTYRLIDPEQYMGKRVLVVGGGDSALEAAIQLADESNAEILISYRNPAFGRCRPANRDRLAALIASGRIKALMSSQISQIKESSVTLDIQGTRTEIRNDYVIVCIGGELPLEFLNAVGVQVERHFGSAPTSNKRVAPSAGASRVAQQEVSEERHRRHLALGYLLVGLVILGTLTWVGYDYYRLPAIERVRDARHSSLRPGGLWGHGVGIVATLVMLSNFLYVARKRWRFLKGRASIRNWLTFHMFVGFMSPLVILFHAAFQSNNLFATMTFVGLLVVVGTGVIGRFIYGLIPGSGERQLALAELLSRFEQHKVSLRPILSKMERPNSIRGLLEWATSSNIAVTSPFILFLKWPIEYLWIRRELLRARGLFHSRPEYLDFRDELFRLVRLKRQLRVFHAIRRLISTWRMFHVVLAIFLLVLIGIHIYVTTYYGYRWIF